MKNTIQTVFLSLLLFLFACKKNDFLTPATRPVPDQFLALPPGSPAYLQRISEEIYRQNLSAGFLPRLEQEEGLPVWRKAAMKILSPSPDTLVLVPLVRKDEKQTSGFLVCKVYKERVDIIDLVRNRYYAAYGFDEDISKATASTVALQSMLFDQKIFGDSSFNITDNRLFSKGASKRTTGESGATSVMLQAGQATVYYAPASEQKRAQGNVASKTSIYSQPEEKDTVVVFLPEPSTPLFPAPGDGNPTLTSGSPSIPSPDGGSSGPLKPEPKTWYNGCQDGKLMFMSDGIKKTECVEFTEPAWKPVLDPNSDVSLSFNDYAVPPFIWTFDGDDGTFFTDLDPLKQSNFKFDLADDYEKNYPRFTKMVRNLKTFVKENPKVLDALQAYSGFTKQQILDHLTFGKGPVIKIKEMTGRFGYYNKKEESKTLFIRASYVRGLEQAFLQSTQEGTAFLLAVTILHEFVHFGTARNNISEGVYDFGKGFERDAFNVIIDDDNAGSVVVKFSKYF